MIDKPLVAICKKTMSQRYHSISWCLTTDLIAILSFEGVIEVNRIMPKLQKIIAKGDVVQPTSTVFDEEGHLLFYSYNINRIDILSTDSTSIISTTITSQTNINRLFYCSFPVENSVEETKYIELISENETRYNN